MSNEQFSGPIAHPKHLREYEDIVPGSAERIISMAEKRRTITGGWKKRSSIIK